MEDYAAFEEAFSDINIKPGLRPTAIDPAVLLSNVQQVESSIRPDAVTLSRSGYVFDSLMENHRPYTDPDNGHPEQPQRIRRIYETLRSNKLLARMKQLSARAVTRDEATLVHSYAHWDSVQAIRGELRRSHVRMGSYSLYGKATPRRTSEYPIIDIAQSLYMCVRVPPKLRNSAVVVGSRRLWRLREGKFEQPLPSSALLAIMPNLRDQWDFVSLATLPWQHESYRQKHQSSEY